MGLNAKMAVTKDLKIHIGQKIKFFRKKVFVAGTACRNGKYGNKEFIQN